MLYLTKVSREPSSFESLLHPVGACFNVIRDRPILERRDLRHRDLLRRVRGFCARGGTGRRR